MARERMITRTVTSTTAHVMEVEVSTASVTIGEYTLAGVYATGEDFIKKLVKLDRQPDGVKFVAVTEMHEVETLYGMAEDDFIKLAKQLPPRTKTE